MSNIRVWYQTDAFGVFIFATTPYEHKPGRAVAVQPPAVPAGKLALWETSLNPQTDAFYGDEGTGAWAIKEDHRKDDLYTTDGKYETGSDYNGHSYNGIGKIPAWLSTTEPPKPEPTLEDLRQAKQDDATSKRWEIMTGGITLASGVQVGTAIDDQNRITSVVANAGLAGLTDADEVDFKATSGWVRITIGEIKQIAGAIGVFVQHCYTAERTHHDAIADLTDYVALDAYDVTTGWPAA